MLVICFREKDRDELLGKLGVLAQQVLDESGTSQKVFVQSDHLSEQALAAHIPTSKSIMLTSCSVVDGAISIYIVTEERIYDFTFIASIWIPRSEDSVEIADSDQVQKRRSMTKVIEINVGKAAVGLLIPKKAKDLQAAQQVAFLSDKKPRLKLTFTDDDSLTIVFYEEQIRETWRETLISLLQKQEPDQSRPLVKGYSHVVKRDRKSVV